MNTSVSNTSLGVSTGTSRLAAGSRSTAVPVAFSSRMPKPSRRNQRASPRRAGSAAKLSSPWVMKSYENGRPASRSRATRRLSRQAASVNAPSRGPDRSARRYRSSDATVMTMVAAAAARPAAPKARGQGGGGGARRRAPSASSASAITQGSAYTESRREIGAVDRETKSGQRATERRSERQRQRRDDLVEVVPCELPALCTQQARRPRRPATRRWPAAAASSAMRAPRPAAARGGAPGRTRRQCSRATPGRAPAAPASLPAAMMPNRFRRHAHGRSRSTNRRCGTSRTNVSFDRTPSTAIAASTPAGAAACAAHRNRIHKATVGGSTRKRAPMISPTGGDATNAAMPAAAGQGEKPSRRR